MVPAPVKLVGEGRIVAGNRRRHVFAPEFLGIQQVFLDHALRLLGRGDAGEQGIEIRGGEATGKAPVPEAVLVDSVLLVPEFLAHKLLHVLILGGEFPAVLVLAQDGGDLRQALGVQSVERIQARHRRDSSCRCADRRSRRRTWDCRPCRFPTWRPEGSHARRWRASSPGRCPTRAGRRDCHRARVARRRDRPSHHSCHFFRRG